MDRGRCSMSYSPSLSLPPLLPRSIPQALDELKEELLSQTIDFKKSYIDPAPFQLVERTSLYKIHSLFSILCLSHAYVTSIGRLVGVVTLKDVRPY